MNLHKNSSFFITLKKWVFTFWPGESQKCYSPCYHVIQQVDGGEDIVTGYLAAWLQATSPPAHTHHWAPYPGQIQAAGSWLPNKACRLTAVHMQLQAHRSCSQSRLAYFSGTASRGGDQNIWPWPRPHMKLCWCDKELCSLVQQLKESESKK